MNIAELFVRLRGDTSDLDRKLSQSERQLLRLHGSTARLEGGFKSATLQTGRLGNQFASLAGQIAGVHPIVGNLAQVMGNFAVGGLVTVGILGATAVFAKFYDVMTKGAREAKKEQDALIGSLEKAIHLKSLGPGGIVVDETAAANKRAAALGKRIELMRGMIVADAMDADVMASNLVIQEKINKLVIERQNALNTAAGGQSIVNEKVNEAIKAQIPTVTKLKDTYMQLRQEIERTRKAVEEEGRAWWANYSMKAAADEELTKSLAAVLLPDFDVNKSVGALKDFGATITGVDTNIGLTKEQIKTRDALIGTLDKNTVTMTHAIANSAQIIAGTISQALNIGGGGRGSAIAGSIGAIVGGAAGSLLGPAGAVITSALGSAVGSVVGGLAGSLLGGLFDNKEAVNSNTSAVRALTQAMLLYAPAGFKAESYRYNASDPRPLDAFGRTMRWNASRGGANPLLGT